jgi:hypothetical protein
MPLRNSSGLKGGLDLGRERQEADRVGHGRLAPADPLGNVILFEPEVVQQATVCASPLERTQVLPLQVFNQGRLERSPIVQVPDDGRNSLEARGRRRPPPPLAGNQLEPARLAWSRSDQDRLEDSMLTDRRLEFGERFDIEAAAWLQRIGPDLLNRDLDDSGVRCHIGAGYQCTKPSAKCPSPSRRA